MVKGKNKAKKRGKSDDVILIDSGYAYVEAVKLLALAGKKARHSGDFDKITQVADLWIALGERLGALLDEDEEQPAEPTPIGFHHHRIGESIERD